MKKLGLIEPDMDIKYLQQILDESHDPESDTYVNFLQGIAIRDAILIFKENSKNILPEEISIDTTCACGLYIHPDRRNPDAIHFSDCSHFCPEPLFQKMSQLYLQISMLNKELTEKNAKIQELENTLNNIPEAYNES